MGQEIKTELDMDQLFKKAESAVLVWQSPNQNETVRNAAIKSLIDVMNDIVKKDYQEIHIENIVNHLINNAKREIVDIIKKESEFNKIEAEVHKNLAVVRNNLDMINSHGEGSPWDPRAVHSAIGQLRSLTKKEIDLNKAMEQIADKVRKVMEQIKADK